MRYNEWWFQCVYLQLDGQDSNIGGGGGGLEFFLTYKFARIPQVTQPRT